MFITSHRNTSFCCISHQLAHILEGKLLFESDFFRLVLVISWTAVSETPFLSNLSLTWSQPIVAIFHFQLEDESPFVDFFNFVYLRSSSGWTIDFPSRRAYQIRDYQVGRNSLSSKPVESNKMEEMRKGIDCPKFVVKYLPTDCKSQVFKQRTGLVGETALVQTSLLWAFSSSGRLVEILLGNISNLFGPCSFKTDNLPPDSENLYQNMAEKLNQTTSIANF